MGRQNKIYLIEHLKIYCFIFVSKHPVFRNTRYGGKQEGSLAELSGGEAEEQEHNGPSTGRTGQDRTERVGL